ncbi:sec-independent protein translocase protein TatA [Haladaptatus litoreus]|uniref:Sec-independent protein translocase protein TatA n=1 Tax=Haladaptatus litoreus TaxID=553468 RepID=A0A1N6YDR7_9EURY|nr:twin-arginine translocase TatA/TatE family subunit [Haladaptatus litoreus]SIR12717.1 sec-independent protein translocase protein TatA [Haladaptatus litoreus]
MYEMIPLFGPVPGGMELAVILLIAVLLFGANKIPKLARSTGEAMGEFKKGRQEVEDELREMQDSGPSDSPSSDASEFDDEPRRADTSTETSTNTETETESGQ